MAHTRGVPVASTLGRCAALWTLWTPGTSFIYYSSNRESRLADGHSSVREPRRLVRKTTFVRFAFLAKTTLRPPRRRPSSGCPGRR